MHMSKAPLSWLKKVEVAMEAAQTIPMWGAAPPFPIAGFGEKIGDGSKFQVYREVQHLFDDAFRKNK